MGFLNKFVWLPEQIIADYSPINVKMLQDGGQLKMIPITKDPYLVSKKDLDDLVRKIKFKSELFSNSYFIFIVIVIGFLIIIWFANYIQYTIEELWKSYRYK